MTDQLQVRIQSATRQYEASATKKLLSNESSLKVYKSSQKGMRNPASGEKAKQKMYTWPQLFNGRYSFIQQTMTIQWITATETYNHFMYFFLRVD